MTNVTTTTENVSPFKNDAIRAFADMFKENGFDIYIYDQKTGNRDFKFTKDGKIGYCSADTDYRDDNRLRFSTVHKPNRQTGTGYGLQMPHEGIINPTIKDAEEAFIFAPNWATSTDLKSIVKYANMDEFLKKETILNWHKY